MKKSLSDVSISHEGRERKQIMKLYIADCTQNAKNVLYPNVANIDSLGDLKQAVKKDHISGLMKQAHRARGNFIKSDCIMLDLDNTHSEDPADWKTIDDICDAFPDVPFYYIQSRNYMKVKTKKDEKTGRTIQQEAREKYHLYFPLRTTYTDEKKYYALLLCAAALFPFFDMASAEPAHFFFGVPDPQGGEESGEVALDDFMRSVSKGTLIESVQDFEEKTRSGQYTRSADAKKAFKRVHALLGMQENDSDENETATRPKPGSLADRIAANERDRSVAWVKDFTQQHDISILGSDIIDQNDKYHPDAIVLFVPCPWEYEHSPGEWPENESVIIVDRGGKLNYLCRHNCHVGKSWKDYRAFYEDRDGGSADQAANQGADPTKKNKNLIFPDYDNIQGKSDSLPISAAQFIVSGAWKRNSDIFARYGNRKTGFENLDEQIGSFYPGVYLLNAGTSMGKTTFSVQLADQLAKNGETILYYAFEQSTFDMVAKSLAREYFNHFLEGSIETHKKLSGKGQDPAEYIWNCAERGSSDAISVFRTTAAGIKKGEGIVSDEFSNWMKSPDAGNSTGFSRYHQYSDRIHYVDCAFGWTIDDVIQSIINYIEETRTAPIVFIDYLQVIKPADDHISDVKAIDYAVQAIRKLAMVSQEKGYPVTFVVISSVSRAQYTAEADISAGKGSGGLEFTADVVWSLQSRVMMTAKYRKAKEQTKRRLVKASKHPRNGKPREIVLEATKNRYGVPDYAVGFNYYPAVETFLPDPKFPEWLLEQQKKEAEAAKRADALAEAKEKKELEQLKSVDPDGFLDIVGTAKRAAEDAVKETLPGFVSASF